MNNYKIAVILTCYNRKRKTLSCLKGLFLAQKAYLDADVSLHVFLTDDGCTDGTAQAVRDSFSGEKITIIQGDGNLFWAGGMRAAWEEALKDSIDWDFFLLINDDTTPLENMFYELISAHEYSLKTYGKPGVYSGVTCDPEDESIITYGGTVWTSKFLGTDRRVLPIGSPQEVDKTNANILLVAKDVTDKIGVFYKGYIHGAADYDYSIQAKKHGFISLITANVCGKCERDHRDWNTEKNTILSMSKEERIKYFSNPIHSSHDFLTFTRRNTPLRYPMVLIGRYLNERFPTLYYLIDVIRSYK